MKRILDPSFRYTPSYDTDLRKTFERIRLERNAPLVERVAKDADEANVVRLEPRKAG